MSIVLGRRSDRVLPVDGCHPERECGFTSVGALNVVDRYLTLFVILPAADGNLVNLILMIVVLDHFSVRRMLRFPTARQRMM